MKRLLAMIMTLCMILGLPSAIVWADAAWQTETPMPTARFALAASAVGDKVYVIGGMASGSYLATVEVYNTETNTWATGTPMPTTREAIAVSVIGSKIYVIGGQGTGGRLNTTEIYDTGTNTWTTGASMPTAKVAPASSVVGSKIYVFGGNGPDGYLNTVEIYNTATNSWITGTPMPTARECLTASVVGTKIYVIGGFNSTSSSTGLATMEIYDTETNTWATGMPMPTARWGLTSSVMGSKIYVMGGMSGSMDLATVEIYDTETNTWTTGLSMPTARILLASAVVDHTIYAIGGRGQTSALSFNTVESLQLPSQPQSLTAAAGNAVVDLSWGSVSDAVSYTVMRATTAGGPYSVIADDLTGTSYSDADVTNGTTYYYVVTAVNSAGESANSNEANATPQEAPVAAGKALLVITMTNGLEKEYDLTMTEVNAFISWYDSKSSGNGQGYYTFNKTFHLGPFLSRVDYITYDKIQNFEVMQYQTTTE